jgi:hypothetical protein
LEQGIREDLVDGLLNENAGGVEPVLSCIIEKVSERDRALLDKLEQMLREKRRALKRRS